MEKNTVEPKNKQKGMIKMRAKIINLKTKSNKIKR